MNKKIVKSGLQYGSVLILLFPVVAHAQTTINSLIAALQSIIEGIIPVIIGLAVVAVLFGLMRYAFKAGDEKAQEEGRRIMFWGVITLFVMVSIWGFVAVLQNLFFGTTAVPGAPDINEFPQLPTTPGGGDPGDSTG